jgi:hypothetical protein
MMRSFELGIAVVALWAALGCGKTGNGAPASAAGGSAGVGGGAAAGVGSGGTGSAGVAGSTNAGAGGRSLPPDGDVPPAAALDKLDLLLMVDNSRNMLEKTRLLEDAVKWLLDPAGPGLAVADIHVGVITSSLGSHGASSLRDVCVAPEDDDHARLLATVRVGVPSHQGLGFLAWGPDSQPSRDSLLAGIEPMLEAAGDTGCGYEASLEAWYRFLVDPTPPAAVVVPMGQTQAERQGVDDVLLQQRAAFLRPDSVLAIVVLSDENDCSIVDEGYGWLVSRVGVAANENTMYRATSACAKDPNDACCQSCGETKGNAGCPAPSLDAACAEGQTLSAMEDNLNLRCWEQKRRFGFDLLYPISRYTNALTRQHVFDAAGNAVQNPLFAGAGTRRHPSQVLVTGIVGVPWQDVGNEASLSGTGLELLTSAQLAENGRWALMLGDPMASPPVSPADPFMVETHVDRTTVVSAAVHPLLPTETLVASSSTNPRANSINGHELLDTRGNELQYACTFQLATPRLCDEAALSADQSCRCYADDLVANSPLCQPPGGGEATTTQHFEAAYPGLRHLQLLESLGDGAVTASICPKVMTQGDADYGYRPAMRALAARVNQALQP